MLFNTYNYYSRVLTKNTKFLSLEFLNSEMEKSYHLHTESFSNITLQAFLVVRLAIGLSQFVVLPRYFELYTFKFGVKNCCIY